MQRRPHGSSTDLEWQRERGTVGETVPEDGTVLAGRRGQTSGAEESAPPVTLHHCFSSCPHTTYSREDVRSGPTPKNPTIPREGCLSPPSSPWQAPALKATGKERPWEQRCGLGLVLT